MVHKHGDRRRRKGKKPWDCSACGSCKEVCPQQIDFPGYLSKLSAKLKEA